MNQDTLKALVVYIPETGDMVFKERGLEHFSRASSMRSWNTRYAGKKAITLDGKGYRVVNLLGKRYLVHRLAWLYVHGVWPEIIDHINGVRTDNALSNLQSVNQQQNHMNNRRASNNTSGTTGVYLNKRRNLWCAQMKFDGKTYHLGSSKNMDDVIAMRKAEELRLGFSDRHGEDNA